MTLDLTRRSIEGTPLTAADYDGNLDKLEDAIEAHVGSGGAAHVDAIADGAAGFMAGADKAKLDGIAAGATANAADAALRDRATHTGEQSIGTVTGLQTALDGKEAAGAVSAHAVAADPHPGYLLESDASVTNARTPTAHQASHAIGGGDALTPTAIGAATAAQGDLADSAVQPGDLATVATTGDYADLSGRPTLGTAAAADTGDFATATQGTDSREWTADTIAQAEAEAGVETTRRAFTAERVRQAIVAWWVGISSTVATAAQGAKADTAFQVVNHAADANVARPTGAPAVYWIGTIEPVNAADGDLWIGGV